MKNNKGLNTEDWRRKIPDQETLSFKKTSWETKSISN